MNFWDSSAVIPLIIQEKTSSAITEFLSKEQTMIVWWATSLECISGLCRKEREGALSTNDFALAKKRLNVLSSHWNEIQPSTIIRETAERLLRNYDLRAADSLQLSSALLACNFRPADFSFITLDRKLEIAASKEGFEVPFSMFTRS